MIEWQDRCHQQTVILLREGTSLRKDALMRDGGTTTESLTNVTRR